MKAPSGNFLLIPIDKSLWIPDGTVLNISFASESGHVNEVLVSTADVWNVEMENGFIIEPMLPVAETPAAVALEEAEHAVDGESRTLAEIIVEAREGRALAPHERARIRENMQKMHDDYMKSLTPENRALAEQGRKDAKAAVDWLARMFKAKRPT